MPSNLNKLLSMLEDKAEHRRKLAVEKGDILKVIEADMELRNLKWVREHPKTFDEYKLLASLEGE